MLAWVSSWSVPAAALMGGGKGGKKGEGKMSGVSNSIPSNYSWLKPSSSPHVNFVDLDKMDRPATASQIPSMMALAFPVASNETVRTFDEKVRSRALKVDAVRGETVKQARAKAAARAG